MRDIESFELILFLFKVSHSKRKIALKNNNIRFCIIDITRWFVLSIANVTLLKWLHPFLLLKTELTYNKNYIWTTWFKSVFNKKWGPWQKHSPLKCENIGNIIYFSKELWVVKFPNWFWHVKVSKSKQINVGQQAKAIKFILKNLQKHLNEDIISGG